MTFTLGNIITLCICLVMVLIFRQLDKNNRSMEKLKKFGEKLKEELAAYSDQKKAKLDESAIDLKTMMDRANAAAASLKDTREKLEIAEKNLVDRRKEVDDFGKQIETYDATIRQLVEMTESAEKNLVQITSESNFADTLAKKLAASQKQLAEISAAIPALKERFAEENRKSLAEIQSDTIGKISSEISALQNRMDEINNGTAVLLDSATEKIKTVYQKALQEAAKRADSMEDAAFVKLKEQATERVSRYKENIEEKTTQLHEQTKTKLQEVQQLLKKERADWKAEADEYLEAFRTEIKELDVGGKEAASRVEDQVKTAAALASSRFDEIQADIHHFESAINNDISAFAEKTRNSCGEIEQSIQAQIEKLSDGNERKTVEFTEKIQKFERQIGALLDATTKKAESDIAEFKTKSSATISLIENQVLNAESLSAERMEKMQNDLAQAENSVSAEITAFTDSMNQTLSGVESSIAEKLEMVSEATGERSAEIEAKIQNAEALSSARIEKLKSELARAESEVNAEISAFGEKIRNSFADIESEVSARFEKVFSGTDEQTSDINSKIAELEKYMQGQLKISADKIETEIVSLEEKLLDKLEASNDGTEKRSHSILEQMRQLEHQVNQSIQNLSEKTGEAITGFEKKLRTDSPGRTAD
ncbi:hypothetical protein K7I13_04475 [Brucepastera parasyntrophica]|uniref:SpiroCoCo family coiled-coil protein n=1 Tax=Brucepastera parasyntrophica TaxID=2880008 RepID=UPI00210E83D7|nr:hypothetical protein [Brucepastera parasyntrophica]ULQ60551.1 hypothetical protein K7I13_04475 [Brucepastera parasyntrophica]